MASDLRVEPRHRTLIEEIGSGIVAGHAFVFVTPDFLAAPTVERVLSILGYEPEGMTRIYSLLSGAPFHFPGGSIVLRHPPRVDLCVLACDKAVYRFEAEEIRAFLFDPRRTRTEVTLEVLRKDHLVRQVRRSLDDVGLLACRFRELPPGSYRLRLAEGEAETSFQVVASAFEVLEATIDEVSCSEGNFEATLHLRAFHEPISGAVTAELLDRRGKVVASTQLEADPLGEARISFFLAGSPPHHLRVQVCDDPRKVTQVRLPAPFVEADHSGLPVNLLGRAVRAFPPGSGTQEEGPVIRGFRFVTGISGSTPLFVEEPIATAVEVVAAEGVEHLQIVSFDPYAQELKVEEHHDVRAGTRFPIPVSRPFGLVTMGAFIGGRCWEGWALGVPPATFSLEIDHPQQAHPGERVELRVRTPQPPEGTCTVWLMVREATLGPTGSLDHELTERIRQTWLRLADTPIGYQDRGIAHLLRLQEREPDTEHLSETDTFRGEDPLIDTAMARARVLYAGTFPLTGEKRVTLDLPRQPATWEVHAVAFARDDWAIAQGRIAATPPLWAWLDVPETVGEGDEVRVDCHIVSTQGGRTCEISGTLDGQPLVFLHRGLPLSSGASLTLSQGEEIVSCWVRGGIVDIVVSDGETRLEQTHVVNLLGRESRGEESLSFALPPAAGGTGKSTGTPLSLPEAACACARPLIDLPGDSLMPEIATIYGALFLALHAPEAGEREEARKRFEAAWSSILSHRDEAAGFRWRTPAEIPPGGERTVAASLLMLAPLREILPLDATLAERSKDLEEMGRIVGKASGLLPLPDLPESVAEAFLLLSTTGEEETRQGTVRWLRDRLATPDPAMTRRERILTAAALFWLDAQFEEVSPATEESAEHGEIPPPMAAEGEAKSAEEEGVVRELEELLTEHLAEENEVLERIFTEHFGPAPQEPISQEAPPELEGEEAEEAPGPSDEALRRYRVGEGYRLALELADTARLSPTDPPVQGIAATLLFAALLRLPESLYPRITRRKERVEVDLTQWRDRIPITCLFQRAERQIDRIYRGDTVDLAIRCDTGWRAGDEVTIWLPQAFSFLHADPSVKRRTFPWRSGEFLTIPLVATGETRGLAGTPAPQHWGLMLSNLFDEQRVTFLDDLEIVIEPGLPPDEELTRFTTLGPEMLAPEGEESGTAAETEEEEPGTILALKETQVAESSDTAPSSDANEMTVIALKGDLEVSPEDYEPIPRPKLLHQEEATRIAHEADAEGIPFLLVQEGIYAGMRFPLDSEKTTIGKGLGNDIHLLDETVNQIHAVIDRDGDTWTIKDLQSHHGTFVNGVRIKKRVLEHHDEIAMGNTKFRFVVPGAQERKEVPRREAASPPEPFSPEERTTTSGRYEEITMPFPGGRREPPPRPDAPPPQMTGDEVNPFLVVLRGRGTQPRYEVVPPLVTIGRSVTNDIQIPDSEMSRKHAEIVFRDGRFILRDLLSTMGTYVNRKLIQGEVVLHDGDEIAMGGTLLQFVMPRPRETEAPPAVGDEVHPQLPYEQTRLHTSASAWDVDDQTRVQRVMTLMIEEGPNAGEKFVISAQRTTIGRSIANDIQIIDQEVSRKHAEILRRDGTFILRDLESTTGTFVNGEPIEEIELQNEDEILIGNTLLVVMFL